MGKRALIFGISGQDGSYLAEFLLGKGYEVEGLVRRSSTDGLQNLSEILDKVKLHYGDLADQTSIDRVVKDGEFDEIYNLGAMSFVPVSWKSAEYTMNINALGPIRILEAIRKFSPETRYYQASTSEMFGKVQETPQKETTPFYPRSPYGVSKVAAHWATINYRESYDLFACCGILFNHESSRRGVEFVTRKITNGVAKIKTGPDNELPLGNLDSKRDWGHSKDYVRAMWLMLQQEKPDDFVIGSDETHSVRDFCEIAFARVGLDYKDHVTINPEFYRPAEVDILLADSSKARYELGWKPEYSFEDLVNEMVDHDMESLNG